MTQFIKTIKGRSITATLNCDLSLTDRLDNVRCKIWVGAVGVLSTGLAVLSSFGMLLYLGCPFVMTVASCPFMILGMFSSTHPKHLTNGSRKDPCPTAVWRACGPQ